MSADKFYKITNQGVGISGNILDIDAWLKENVFGPKQDKPGNKAKTADDSECEIVTDEGENTDGKSVYCSGTDTSNSANMRYPDMAGQPFTRISGIPIWGDSLDASMNIEPAMTAPNGLRVPLARLDQPIQWEGLFILPNYQSRLNLYLHQSSTYKKAIRKMPYRYVLPMSTKITHMIRCHGMPKRWEAAAVQEWPDKWEVDADE